MAKIKLLIAIKDPAEEVFPLVATGEPAPLPAQGPPRGAEALRSALDP
jgi:hypothetical protein